MYTIILYKVYSISECKWYLVWFSNRRGTQLIYHVVHTENYSCCATRKLNTSESHEHFYNDALGHAEDESGLIFIITIIANIKKNLYIEKNKRYKKCSHYSRYHHLIFIIIIIIIVFIHRYCDVCLCVYTCVVPYRMATQWRLMTVFPS